MNDERQQPRVAIVGCGRMGEERASRAASSGANVRACADAEIERATALASRYPGAEPVHDASKLPWTEIDAVFVCTPPSARDVAVRLAIEHGVAILVEKPIGLSASAGAAFAEGVATAGIVNAVGYMNRYRASVRRAREFVEKNGATLVMCHWASRPYAVPWWNITEQSGGPFNEQATHLVDLCRYVVGEIAAVEALAGRADGVAQGPPTRFAAALRFVGGALGTLSYTCEAPDKFIAFEIVSDDGALRLEGWDFALSAGACDVRASSEPNVFQLETNAFLEAVVRKDQSLVACSFAEAARTQATVDLIRAATS